MIDPQAPDTGATFHALGHIDALPVGTVLGEFELQGLIGVGGFGMVYRGYDHSLQRPVAIKEYMPSALVSRVSNNLVSARSAADAAPFQSGLQSFIAEARLLARFDHPSLVKVYRFWEANNTAYMVMPLYQGMTLKQARSEMSAPPPEDWLRVVIWSVLEALKVLHAADALHRDVSPDNIFLQDVGPPVLLDLGAARLAILGGSQKHTAVLKVNYAPIEQYADASDLREGPWTDLYALAAVIHGCLCNEPPLPATFRIVKDRLAPIAKVARTVESHFGQAYSPYFIRAIDHALSVQPGDRPQTVAAFARDLRLRTVRNPHAFNWRAELGDKVMLTGSVTPKDLLTTQPGSGQAKTVPMEGGRGMDLAEEAGLFTQESKPAASVRSANSKSDSAPGWRRNGLVGTLLLIAAALATAVYLVAKPAAPVTPAATVAAPLPNPSSAASVPAMAEQVSPAAPALATAPPPVETVIAPVAAMSGIPKPGATSPASKASQTKKAGASNKVAEDTKAQSGRLVPDAVVAAPSKPEPAAPAVAPE
jgi:serine/threonine protein kinase